jgi:spore coat protein CotF
MGVLGKLVKMGTDIDDQVLFAYALNAAKTNSKAYLTATLVSTSTELRTFFSSLLTQNIHCHSALVALGIKKGWLEPDCKPKDNLQKELEKVECLFNEELSANEYK